MSVKLGKTLEVLLNFGNLKSRGWGASVSVSRVGLQKLPDLGAGCPITYQYCTNLLPQNSQGMGWIIEREIKGA